MNLFHEHHRLIINLLSNFKDLVIPKVKIKYLHYHFCYLNME